MKAWVCCSFVAETSFIMLSVAGGGSPAASIDWTRLPKFFSPCSSTYHCASLARTAALSRATPLPRGVRAASSIMARTWLPVAPPPDWLRSTDSTVMAQAQPSPSAPIRLASGITASVKKVSLKSALPVICRIGRTSTPRVFMSTTKKVRPSCLGTAPLERASRMP